MRLILGIAAWLVARLPWSWLRGPGQLLGWIVANGIRIRRRHVEHAMTRAGVDDPHARAAQVYASLGTGVFEFLWLAGRHTTALEPVVLMDSTDWARVRQALELGRGLVVATAHTGNWDLLACAMAERVPLTIITKHLSWRPLDRFWQRSRARRRVGLLDGPGAMRAAGEALAQGRVVAVLIDQAPEHTSGVMQAPFLGAAAWHDLCCALLAARHHAPLVTAFGERLADGRHRVRIGEIWIPPARGSRRWSQQAALDWSRALEEFVREHPDQWLWLHRRWKPAPTRRMLAPCIAAPSC